MNHDIKRSGAYSQCLRIQSGYTQNELSKAMNMSQSTLSRIEAGCKGCSVDMFVQFSELFHVSLDSLILGTEPDMQQEAERKVHLKASITEIIHQLAQLRELL